MHVPFLSRSGHKRLGGRLLRTMMNICRTLGKHFFFFFFFFGGGDTLRYKQDEHARKNITQTRTDTHRHAQTRTDTHAHTHTRTHTRTHARTHARTNACTRTHARAHTRAHTHARCKSTHCSEARHFYLCSPTSDRTARGMICTEEHLGIGRRRALGMKALWSAHLKGNTTRNRDKTHTSSGM